MPTEGLSPHRQEYTSPPHETKDIQLVLRVPALAVMEEVSTLIEKGVSVFEQVITVEFSTDENTVVLADYKYRDGSFRLIRKYDEYVNWPESVRFPLEMSDDLPPEDIPMGPDPDEEEAAIGEMPPAPPAPPAPPVVTKPTPTFTDPAAIKQWEVLTQYWRLKEQVEQADAYLQNPQVIGRNDEATQAQRRRLEIGKRNMAALLEKYPQFRGMPRPVEQHSADLATEEGREEARRVLREAKLPRVEEAKRVIATHKADAQVKLEQVAATAVRPPVTTLLSQLGEAQHKVQRLNNLGLFRQLQYGEQRHNNLVVLRSTRESLENMIRRFTPRPQVSQQLNREYVSMLQLVVEAAKKLEQGTQQNFLSRWWQKDQLKEQNQRIMRGLKQLENFTHQHPEFL